MAITYSTIFSPTVLTTSAATLFTVPVSPTSTLFRGGRMRFTNTSAVAVSFTAYGIPSGGSASAGNCFANNETVPPNVSIDKDIPLLGAGGFVQALASAATSITAHAIAGSFFA